MDAALEYFEEELIPFLAILSQQRFDILNCGSLERLKPVAFVNFLDDADDVLTPPHVRREKIAHAARWLCFGGGHLIKTTAGV
jgi:hypothetical protein